RLRVAAEVAHRMDAAADAFLCLEHEHVAAFGFETQCGVQARKSGADDDDVVVSPGGHVAAPFASATTGLVGPGRPLRQQSGGQKSWAGPSVPSARRVPAAVMRSAIRSLTMATNAGCVPTVPARI